MAHTCPVCGQTCNCGGDWDDICLEDPEDIENCTHCPDDDDSDEDGFDDTDYDTTASYQQVKHGGG
jgi:hypothetical protein